MVCGSTKMDSTGSTGVIGVRGSALCSISEL
jgi:hypothetical protein